MNRRVKEWLNFAEEDLHAARVLTKERIFNQSCFHSQQCVEKSLKALIESKQKVPKIHKLVDLLTICIQLDFPLENYRNDFEFIDKFYTSTRYPFIVSMLPGGLPTMEDAEKSLALANKIYEYICQILIESASS
jgi:HEPN domain-containing protein